VLSHAACLYNGTHPFTTTGGQLVFHLFGLPAELARNLMRERPAGSAVPLRGTADPARRGSFSLSSIESS
jgi:hypothetical protein